ncbi:MAG TPA: hypothetical protein VE954_34210 [Oligoflexus sp.]|nr:hypothetical protein [Oligoflexus sp.]
MGIFSARIKASLDRRWTAGRSLKMNCDVDWKNLVGRAPEDDVSFLLLEWLAEVGLIKPIA